MLNLANCRERQGRLLREMEARRLDLVVLANPKTIYYFTGALLDPALPQAFAVTSSGGSLLVAPAEPEQAAADHVELYTSYTIGRVFNRVTMQQEVVAAVTARFEDTPGPAGFEFDCLPYGLGAALRATAVDVSPCLYEMRRRKDPDEIEAIREAIRITEAAYAAIKPRLEPGMTECDCYNVVSRAMVDAAGTAVLLRGDFACGVRAIRGGGPPTRRKLEPGDLCVFDLFPTHEGYLCDLCRTFVVGRASAAQQDAWAHVMEAHRAAASVMRPGATGREVYQAVRDHLEAYPAFHGSFHHHAGHGLGMDGWEFPWLTPSSDQVLQAGEVVACEPGLYGEDLRGGIRLEHNYLIGAGGVTALDAFPMEL